MRSTLAMMALAGAMMAPLLAQADDAPKAPTEDKHTCSMCREFTFAA